MTHKRGRNGLTHGQSQQKKQPASTEYRAWANAHSRCNNSADPHYADYGGRGIRILLAFEEFLTEVGAKPSPDLTIDRINNNGNYEAGNLRWATHKEQRANRRQVVRRPTCKQGHATSTPDGLYKNGNGKVRCKQCVKNNAKKQADAAKAFKYPLFPMDEELCKWAVEHGQL